jgi:hypothetical protein
MDLKPCPDHICNGGSGYWALTQMCGQDKLWMKPDAKVLLTLEDGTFCYCKCTPGQTYCYKPNCVSNMVNVMNQCSIDQLSYQQFVSMTGQVDPNPCQCPCPHQMCTFCDDPLVKDYVKQNCDESGWWPGYPIVMSAGGGQFCTCLCPDSQAKTMAIAVPEGEAPLLQHVEENDTILAAGLDLAWKPTKVKARTRSSTVTPVPAVALLAADRGITLIADQLVLADDGKLRPAFALYPGEILRGADGKGFVLDEVKRRDIYAAPLPFLATAFDPPDGQLSDRLLNINGFVVGDYSLQLFHTLGMIDRELLRLERQPVRT